MKLKFTRRGVRDLERLRAFIAEHNPEAANRVNKRLRNSIEHLVENPQLGKEVEDLPNVRDFIIRPYRVRYAVTDDVVVILRVWHGKEAQL